LREPESGAEVEVTTTSHGASPSDAVEGKRNLKEVGPTDRPDSQEAVRDSVRDQLHGRMNFCREMEGTGDLGKSSDSERIRGQNASDVEKDATGKANKTPQETKTLREYDRTTETLIGKTNT
jgi:hypothetical protein